MKRKMCKILAAAIAVGLALPLFMSAAREVMAADDTIVIRVCNWEEYIDEGEWGEDEVIDLESGDISAKTD